MCWHDYVNVMMDFRREHNLGAVRDAFLLRYYEAVQKHGVMSAGQLREAMWLSAREAFQGWPPPVLLGEIAFAQGAVDGIEA